MDRSKDHANDDWSVTDADVRIAGTRQVAIKLVVVAGPDEGRECAINETMDIGTDRECSLVLTDSMVSRQHVAIRAAEGRILVNDLGSRNGTFIAGVRINRAEPPLGTVLHIGRSAIAIYPRWQVREVQPSSRRQFGELFGESLAMRELFAILERVAPTDVTVLVEGESGTGKELAARSIHAVSARASRPYVVFDCGSIPHELAESELFGHKRGAFSGALADRAGAFQAANTGTIFLDEVGELPLELQPKLLRVLESGEARAVGDDTPRKFDVRILAATNRDLHAEAERGRFRADLLYRLEVVKVRMPPLRQRPGDIPGLVKRLLKGKLSDAENLDAHKLAQLMAYSWPGNVRELRNTLLRAVTLALPPGGSLPSFTDLRFNLGPASTEPLTIGTEFPGVSAPLPYKTAKAQVLLNFHRAYLGALLERHHGNIQQAAAAAGISRKHVYELLRRVDDGETSWLSL